MTYPQYYAPNNYYQQSPFVNALQQTYQPQQQTQQTIGMKIIPVSNKDEANATPVDLVSGIPTFFYNKGTNEIYLKQFDVANGTAILKTYKEETAEQPKKETPNYKQDLNYIKDGIDGLYKLKDSIDDIRRLLDDDEEEEEEEVKPIKKARKK